MRTPKLEKMCLYCKGIPYKKMSTLLRNTFSLFILSISSCFLILGTSELFKYWPSFFNDEISYKTSSTAYQVSCAATFDIKYIESIFLIPSLIFFVIMIIVTFVFLDILNRRNRHRWIFDVNSRKNDGNLKIFPNPVNRIISYWSTWLTAYKLTSSIADHRRYCLQQQLKPAKKIILWYDE
jgi:hypothetical protein